MNFYTGGYILVNSKLLKYQLPDIYRSLLPRDLLHFEMVETKATCGNCLMSKDKAAKIYYKPDLKCCTFEPFLPNYLVGALLKSSQTSDSAKLHLRNKIRKLEYALPIGMAADIPYQVKFNNRGPTDFGNDRDLLCPYYNQELNNCGIWKYRGSVCSTFFCKSDFGKSGLNFWADLGSYLNYVEMALLEEILAHLDFSPRQVNENLELLNRKTGSKAELDSKSLPLDQAKKLWNGYFDDPDGFYIKCYEIALSFDRKRLKEVMGSQGAEMEESLKNMMEKL